MYTKPILITVLQIKPYFSIFTALLFFSSFLAAFTLIPSLTEPIRGEIEVLEKELESLPRTPLSISPWTHGFSSRQHQTPEKPVQIDITLPEPAPVDLVALMPATYTDDQDGVRAFGFPVRFSIERVLPDGSLKMLANHLYEDYPTPGLEPQIFSCPDPVQIAGLRITVTDLPYNPTWWRATKAVAFSELFAFSGARNVALGAKVEASESFDFSYIWSPVCLTDGFFPFAPVDLELTDPENNFSIRGKDEVVMDFDLGTPSRIDEIRFWPVVHSIQHHFPNSSGVGFPTRIRVEVREQKEFVKGEVIYETDSIRARPGSDPLMLRTDPARGRYIRVTLGDGYPDFRFPDPKRIALSEIEFLENGRLVSANVIPRAIGLGWQHEAAQKLTDGSSNVGRIMPLRHWIIQYKLRVELEKKLGQLGLNLEVTQRKEEQRFRTLLLAAIACIVVLLQVIWLVRVAARRRAARMRERIACDLHDEIGANVSSMAHTTELLAESIKEPNATQARLLSNLLESAQMTYRETKNFIRFIEGENHLHDIAEHFVQVADQILGTIPRTFSLENTRSFNALDPATKWNLLLFYKEALNNIIKHAEASEVTIKTHRENRLQILEVIDNGKGFSKESHLCRRLEERALIMRGELKIESQPGQGTHIFLCFKNQ